jgi:predicted Zn-dependent protease
MPGTQQARLLRIEELLTRDPARAKQEAQELLDRAPESPKAQLLQGIACRFNGEPAAAATVLSRLSEQCPDAVTVYLQLGLALRESGDSRAAVEALRRATRTDRQCGDAWLALADLLTDLPDATAANEAYLEYVRVALREPQLQMAGAALREVRLADAESLLRARLQHYPRDVVALCLLADIAEQLGARQDAEQLLEHCLALAPGYMRARHNYAVVLLHGNRAPEALDECRKLLATHPENADVRKLQAAILVRLREYEESIRVCETLVDENPDQPAVWTSMGHMLKSIGRREQCIAAYRRAMEFAPQFGEPYWSLMNLKTYQASDTDLDAMSAQLAKADLDDKDRWHFHFAMGRALEQRENFGESFRNYSMGNALRRQHQSYDINELADHVRRSRELFSDTFFADRRGSGADAQDTIFIVGLPRSGSTLVEQILASHSAVEGTMELTDLAGIANALNVRAAGSVAPGYPDVLAALDPAELHDLGHQYLAQTQVQRKTPAPCFIDKMPNNFAHVGLIHLVLPRAKIIDVRRHPMACGMSLFKEHFARAQNFSYSLDDIGRYYALYVELMAHFDRVLPGRVHRVIYEDLVEDTEGQVRRLLDYCKLPFEPACLEFHKNPRAVSTASSEQVRAPIYRDGLEHWRNFAPWLEPLRKQLGSLAETYPLI